MPDRTKVLLTEDDQSDASRVYTLSSSLGSAPYRPENPCSIFELLRRAGLSEKATAPSRRKLPSTPRRRPVA